MNEVDCVVKSGPSTLYGRHLVPARDCWYPPAVAAVDLLDVDFDQRSITGDGLYLVEILGEERVDWRGCRRFCTTPHGLNIDVRGDGEWKPIDSPADYRMCIVGRVQRVYKPAN